MQKKDETWGLDPRVVEELREAYHSSTNDRAEELDGILRLAVTIRKVAGDKVATAWLKRQAKLTNDQEH